MSLITDFHLHTLLPDPRYNSTTPVDDQKLLLPDFLEKLNNCIAQYKQKHPDQDISFSETYRSNTLQMIYFKRGTSKVQKNGMHHYGIAADSIFIIDGKQTYKGDINLLRQIYKTNGLTVLGMWDPLHVQFITVSDQPALRNDVSNAIKQFQSQNGLPPTGEADDATLTKARQGVLPER
jgi:hypothetical protein